ncbi:protoporphyrinogen oxidase-like isoform X1 [Chamaea fasciata]|uniref:protoporphyrinogen oxidase-like isoform X1 n=1 Tax=Chamaea fasciata TaxID=190680 RepID=UPI00336AA612
MWGVPVLMWGSPGDLGVPGVPVVIRGSPGDVGVPVVIRGSPGDVGVPGVPVLIRGSPGDLGVPGVPVVIRGSPGDLGVPVVIRGSPGDVGVPGVPVVIRGSPGDLGVPGVPVLIRGSPGDLGVRRWCCWRPAAVSGGGCRARGPPRAPCSSTAPGGCGRPGPRAPTPCTWYQHVSPQVSELGLAGDILAVPGDHPASRNRFLYLGGTLHPLPQGLRWVAPVPCPQCHLPVSPGSSLSPVSPPVPNAIPDPELSPGAAPGCVPCPQGHLLSLLSPRGYSGLCLVSPMSPVSPAVPDVPRGLLWAVPPFSRALLWSGLRDLLTPAGTGPDESAHAFAQRRFGREVAEVAVDSLCRGVFAGDSRVLSVRSCFPALFHAERRRGSVLLGMALGHGDRREGPAAGLARRARAERWSQWSLRGGMEALPRALVTFVSPRGAELRCHAPLTHLCHRRGRWQLTFPGGSLTADHVLSALPAAALAQALPAELSPLARELRDIPAATVAVVNLHYRGVTLPVTGFGHLVPSWEDPALLGVVYDSVAFPEHDGSPGSPSVRLTVMLGGAWFRQSFGDPSGVSPQVLLARARAAVRDHLGLAGPPARAMVRVQQDCIPQYTLGHWERLERIQKFLREQRLPLSLIGASYWGVSVNDCIAGAKAAVGRVLGSPPEP